MSLVATVASIDPVFCLIALSTLWTSLAGIPWVDIDNLDSNQIGLILDVVCKSIERPAVQTVIVFTACSCRATDSFQIFQLDYTSTLLDGKLDNLPADFVILILHPAVFFLSDLFDSLAFFLLL